MAAKWEVNLAAAMAMMAMAGLDGDFFQISPKLEKVFSIDLWYR